MRAVKATFECVVFVLWMLLVSGGMAYAAEEEDMRVLWATKPLVLPEHEVGGGASVVTGYEHVYVALALRRGSAGGVLAAVERKSGKVGWLRPLERSPAGSPALLAMEYWDGVIVSCDVATSAISDEGVDWKFRVLAGERPMRVMGIDMPASRPELFQQREGDQDWLIKSLAWESVVAVSGRQLVGLNLFKGYTIWEMRGVVPAAYVPVILGRRMTCLARLPGNHGRNSLCQIDLEAHEVRWVLGGDDDGVQAAPTAFDWRQASVYCALSDGTVVEVEGESGKVVRRLKARFTRAPVSMRIIGGTVCAMLQVPETADAGRVVLECIDLKDDKLKWRKEFRECVGPPVWSDRGVWVLRGKSVSRIMAADGVEQTLGLTEAPLLAGNSGAAEHNRLYCVDALGRLLCIGDVGDARRASEWSFDAAEAVRRQQKAAEALRTEVRKELDLGAGVKMRLALVPAGEFMMGSPPEEATEFDLWQEAFFDEEQHMVRITKAFYMGVTEVTQGQYERIMGVNPSYKKSGRGPTQPVNSVTWDDAQEFCRRLGKAVKGQVRLPTEAEWEYACRAGTAGPYHVSREVWKEIVSFRNPPGGPALAAVATKRPNAWGLYDMHGNVFEWCQDWYDWSYYRWGSEEDPTGPSYGKYRVLRSGSWFILPQACRSAQRCFDTPDDKGWSEYVSFQPGFRVVMSLE